MSARNRIYPVFIPHLGCPHACVFCNQHEITGAAAEEALRKLNSLTENPPQGAAYELAFYGGSFTAIPEAQQLRYLEAAGRARDCGAVSSIRLSTRPDAVTREILERLKRYGVGTVELGAQSMQEPVLRASGRGHSAADVRRASELIREAGLSLVLQMMTGLPGDDDDGAVDTARQLIALQPDAVRIYPTVIVRGTELERLWRRGEYREHTVEDAVRVCARLLPLFDTAGIPVIRLGLNPTDELSGGAALAGAYHPALGELVRSRVLRNRAEQEMEKLHCKGQFVSIRVPEKKLSQMLGQKRCNVDWLKKRFHLAGLEVCPDREVTDLVIEKDPIALS
jgi:histone acetyltransferase (RNA polymerase elongator complex component)